MMEDEIVVDFTRKFEEKMALNLALTDILGLCLMFFGAIWCLYGFYLYVIAKRDRKFGLLVGGVALICSLVFIFMTASTPQRRAYINLDMRGLFNAFVGFFLAVLVASTAFYIDFRVAKRLHGRGRSNVQYGIVASVLIVTFMGLLTLYLYANTYAPDLDEVFTTVESVEGVTIQGGIPIKIFENATVQAPTALELGPDNELYVAGASGFIWVMDDPNLDGVADNVGVFARDLNQPVGLAWGEGGLYVNTAGQTLFLQDTDGDRVADEQTVIVDGFPGEVYAFHQNNGLTFGPDGRLYIGSGATTDNQAETHPMAARIFSVNPDGTDLRVYATGTRNPYGLIPAPDGGFFAVDNGSSGCIPNTDCSEKIDVPEELNYILEGKDYGFPDYYGMPPEDSGTMPPLMTFPEHSAPTGIEIYGGNKFPTRFKGQVFVSLWARGEIYRIKLYKMDAEHYTGASLIFAQGLTGPSALLNSPDGGLYVASYTGNAIYHIG
jgi:putative membrane-bound dehydrogenase-like protein